MLEIDHLFLETHLLLLQLHFHHLECRETVGQLWHTEVTWKTGGKRGKKKFLKIFWRIAICCIVDKATGWAIWGRTLYMVCRAYTDITLGSITSLALYCTYKRWCTVGALQQFVNTTNSYRHWQSFTLLCWAAGTLSCQPWDVSLCWPRTSVTGWRYLGCVSVDE